LKKFLSVLLVIVFVGGCGKFTEETDWLDLKLQVIALQKENQKLIEDAKKKESDESVGVINDSIGNIIGSMDYSNYTASITAENITNKSGFVCVMGVLESKDGITNSLVSCKRVRAFESPFEVPLKFAGFNVNKLCPNGHESCSLSVRKTTDNGLQLELADLIFQKENLEKRISECETIRSSFESNIKPVYTSEGVIYTTKTWVPGDLMSGIPEKKEPVKVDMQKPQQNFNRSNCSSSDPFCNL